MHKFKSSRTKVQHPAVMALFIELCSLFCVLTLATQSEITFNLVEWSILQGFLAATLSFLLRQPVWWIPMHLSFSPLLWFALTFDISPSWYLIAFAALLLIYGKTFRTRVPLYLSSKNANAELAKLLPQQTAFSFVDLGSGCGGLLKNLARSHQNGQFHGIESAPLPFLISHLRNRFLGSPYTITWGDFWRHDFSNYDVVYAYLSPVPMEALWQKVNKEMRSGSLFISNTFIVPGVKPHKSIKLNDFSNSTLFIWKI